MLRIIAKNVERILSAKLKGYVKVSVHDDKFIVDIDTNGIVFHSIISNAYDYALTENASIKISDEVIRSFKKIIVTTFFKN